YIRTERKRRVVLTHGELAQAFRRAQVRRDRRLHVLELLGVQVLAVAGADHFVQRLCVGRRLGRLLRRRRRGRRRRDRAYGGEFGEVAARQCTFAHLTISCILFRWWPRGSASL